MFEDIALINNRIPGGTTVEVEEICTGVPDTVTVVLPVVKPAKFVKRDIAFFLIPPQYLY